MRTTNGDVAIIGAGIVGLFCGYFLAARGLKVTILERRTPGSGSSLRNGGGVRSQWGTATNIQLSVLSAPYWATFEDRFGTDIGLRRIGYLFLASQASGLEELERNVALQHEFGVDSEILTSDEVAIRWPPLAGLDVAGASFCATDGFVNQHRLLFAMQRAAETAGVTIESGVEVTGLALRSGQINGLQTTAGTFGADVVVNCAGAWAPALAKQLGVALPIRGRRVQLMLARPSAPLPADLPWLIHPQGVHLRQDVDGQALVGGFLGRDETVDPTSFDHDADDEWIATVLAGVAEHLRINVDRASVVDSWAGLYPTTPDQHPIIDRTEQGLVVVGGFAGAGVMHAPAAGLLAAELVGDGRISSIDPGPISLARFAEPLQPIEATGF